MSTATVADPPDTIDRLLGLASALPLLVIVGLTFIDVFARYVFARPVQGASEVIQFAMALTIFCALPLVTRHNGHVTVDLFTHSMSTRSRALLQMPVDLLSALALALIGWRLWVQANEYAADAITTIVLEWGMAPLTYTMSVLAFMSTAIVLMRLPAAARIAFGHARSAS